MISQLELEIDNLNKLRETYKDSSELHTRTNNFIASLIATSVTGEVTDYFFSRNGMTPLVCPHMLNSLYGGGIKKDLKGKLNKFIIQSLSIAVSVLYRRELIDEVNTSNYATVASGVARSMLKASVANEFLKDYKFEGKKLVHNRRRAGYSDERINNMMYNQFRKKGRQGSVTFEDILQGVLAVMPLLNVTGIISMKHVRRTVMEVKLTDMIKEKIEDFWGYAIQGQYQSRSLIEEPVPYNENGIGGFHSEPMQILCPAYGSLYTKPSNMERYLNTVNTMQKTAWAINKKMLSLLDYSLSNSDYLKRYQHKLFGVSPHEDTEGEMTKSEFLRRKQNNEKAACIITQHRHTLAEAKTYAEYDKFWFTWFFDYRGRYYPHAGLVSPQGTKISRGLLQFAEGEELKSQEAVDFFRAEVVKNLDYDKLNIKDRVDLFPSLEKKIVAIGEAIEKELHPPHEELWAIGKDSFIGLSYCHAWYKIHKNPLGATVYLPCTIDGSCNGLQHISALTRDASLGIKVNMVDNTQRYDIYQEAANEGKVQVSKLEEGKLPHILSILPPKKRAMMKEKYNEYHKQTGMENIRNFWMKQTIPRKVPKSAVMTVPYNSTQSTQRQYIASNLYDLNLDYPLSSNGLPDPNYRSVGIDCILAGVHISTNSSNLFRSIIRKYVDAVRDSGIRSHNEQIFQTPFGMPFINKIEYTDKDGKSRHTNIQSGVKALKVLKLPSRDKKVRRNINFRKLIQGGSPSIIHAFDACHMTMVVEGMKELDDNVKLWMIHDSYGCSPNLFAELNKLTRDKFVDLHQNYGIDDCLVMKEHIPEYKLPNTLDLEKVRDNEYFFN